MRCLRCALEYGPEEKYCQRCGRALSRPLGSKAAVASDHIKQVDSQSVYSTFVPPSTPIAEAISSSAAVSGAASAATQPEPAFDTPDSIAPLEPEQATPETAEPREARSGVSGMRNSTTGLSPAGPPPHAWTEQPAPVETSEAGWSAFVPNARGRTHDDLFDDDPLPVGRGGKPALIGSDDKPGRRWGRPDARSSQRATLPRANLRISPRLLGLAVVVVLLLLIAGIVLGRHSAYTTDLQKGMSEVAARQYAAAINDFNKAIAEWPMNSAAQNWLALAQADANAAALKIHAQADIEATRQGMYAAHILLVRQVATQMDAAAGGNL